MKIQEALEILGEGKFEQNLKKINTGATKEIVAYLKKSGFKNVRGNPREGISLQDKDFEYQIFLDISGGEM